MLRTFSLEPARHRGSAKHARGTRKKPTPRHFPKKFVFAHYPPPDERALNLLLNRDKHGHSAISCRRMTVLVTLRPYRGRMQFKNLKLLMALFFLDTDDKCGIEKFLSE